MKSKQHNYNEITYLQWNNSTITMKSKQHNYNEIKTAQLQKCTMKKQIYNEIKTAQLQWNYTFTMKSKHHKFTMKWKQLHNEHA